MMKSIIFSLLMLFSTAVISAPLSNTQLRDIIIESLTNKKYVDQHAKTIGLTGEKKKIIEEHYHELAKTPEVINYIVEQLSQIGIDDERMSANEVLLMVSNISTALSLEGIRNATVQDKEQALANTIQIIKLLDYNDCAFYLFNNGSENADRAMIRRSKIQRRIWSKMSISDMRMQYKFTRKMSINGINHFASYVPMDETELNMAILATRNSFDRRLTKYYPEDKYRLSQALANPYSATNIDACRASIVFMESILDLSGKNKEYALNMFFFRESR